MDSGQRTAVDLGASIETRRLRRLLVSCAAALLLLTAIAPLASAVTRTYALSSQPQSVSGHGSNAKSYGTWLGKDRSATSFYTALDARYKYTDADNHTVYTKFDLSAEGRTSGATWNGGDASSHESIVSSSWRSFTSPAQIWDAMNTSGVIDATATVRTCLDIPLRPDTCSGGKTIKTSF